MKIKGIVQNLCTCYENWKLQMQARTLFEKAREGMDLSNEEGISARQAADMYWLSVYLAEKSGNQDLAAKFKDESEIYLGYDPLESENAGVKVLANRKKQREKINTLENMAESRLRLGLTERALDYYLQAIELTKELRDQKLLETLKLGFEKASKEMYSGN